MQWLQQKSTRLPIFVQDPQIFWSKEGAKIVWNPTAVIFIPKEEELQQLQNYCKTRSRKSFWREQRRRCNKQDWSAVRLRQPKLQKETGSRRTRIYRRALGRDNLSTSQERSFSYPQWGRTVNNKQETRKRLFGVRLFKKKSKKGSLGSIEGRLYCRLVQEKTTKNRKSKAAPRSSLLSGPHVATCDVEQALVYGNSKPQDHEGRRFLKARQQSQPPRGGYRLYWR